MCENFNGGWISEAFINCFKQSKEWFQLKVITARNKSISITLFKVAECLNIFLKKILLKFSSQKEKYS